MSTTFYDLVDQVIALLQQRGRLSYRALKRQFDLDDASLDDLKFELVEVQGAAADHAGSVLVWTGRAGESAPVLPATPVEPPHDTATALEALEAERRQLSVLFCDLVGSTALAAAVDPEELREVLRAYQRGCAVVVERFGGVIARQIGDGLLVNFGYPRAHEDDAGRAVRAGLGIVGALPGLNAQLAARVGVLRARPLQVRIAVHTGPVVVGVLGASGYRDPMAVVGETPAIAARLQELAEPDVVVVSGATHRLLGEAFDCDDLGLHALKGVAAPVRVYRVLREREGRDLATVSRTERPIPLVGREQELGVLLDRWEQCKESLGQFVLLIGEAGIGKSRLVRELKARVSEEPHTLLEGRGSPYHEQSAFYPWTDLLQRALRFERGDSPEARRDKLDRALHQHRLPTQEMLPILAALLGLAAVDETTLATGSPRHRQQTMEALQGLVLQPAAQHPVLMVIEDLHWADPSTLEVLELLLNQTSTARLLVVLTARPNFRLPWGGREPVTWLTLTRLRRAQVARLAAAVAKGKALPGEVLEQVVLKTDGVPLFVEELTKMIVETGLVREGEASYEMAGPLPPLAIPTTLQDSLMARLDRLPTTKAVAQVAATLGRSFSFELLQAVTGMTEAALAPELTKLVDAELLYQRGLPPHATYSFKHALIQDAAYQTLLRSSRQQYHLRIAQALETRFPEIVETQPELLAHHYSAAGLAAHAIPFWQRAGERAAQRSAYLEAISHFRRGLEQLEGLADSPQRARQELDLRLALGRPLVATRGFAVPEVEDNYTRARELSRHMENTAQVRPALYGLFPAHLIRAEFQTTRELGEQLLAQSEHAVDPAGVAAAHRILGTTSFYLGSTLVALEHFRKGRALHDTERGAGDLYGREIGVHCRVYEAMAAWLLGYPDQALRTTHEARSLARELSDPFSQGIALVHSAWIHQFRREPEAARDWAEAARAFAGEQGFASLGILATMMLGGALAQRERPQDGIALMRRGLQELRATGAGLAQPYYLALLAEAHADEADIERGSAALDEAFAVTENTGERWWEAEQHRLKGDLLLRQPAPDEAQAARCFRTALDVAAGQAAKSLELRAAISLSRLLHHQRRTEDAHRLLTSVYGWFTEGFDTIDLQEAKALIDALS